MKYARLVLTHPALIAGIGATLCTLVLTHLDEWQHELWLMAPFGATMVILFGLPASPLAQPKNIILGHLLTTLVGLVVLHTWGMTPLSLSVAVGMAISLMLLTKTTHPPAGANPLVVMLTAQDWPFLIAPVLTGALLITLSGWLYHKWVSGQPYPVRQN
ncbi:HPP family protein [Bowmanella yangjiangensis]|uniref:HPP family protein n=1 Tax=Bowmanella yangjiangensis TaxID=2811230 RepID=UPI001E3A6C5C|nr:HPP family protein [Bowmanella yangjiangensis]